MALVEDVNKAITDAMKARDAARLVALRMLKAAFMNREVERGRALDEGEARQVVSALVKQRRDSIEQFHRGGRQDLVDIELFELSVLQAYMPQALSEGEVVAAVAAAIQSSGAKGMADMGKAMAVLKPQLAGRADMGKVSALVKAKLSAP